MWLDAVSKPAKTFAAELKKKPALGRGALYLLISAVVSVAITLLFGRLDPQLSFYISAFSVLGYLLWAVLVPLMIVFSILGWLVLSGILYLLARLLGGKGTYTPQSYLIAIYTAPLNIITAVAALGGAAGMVINLLITVYSLYLLTIALKAVHKYSTGRAILTWLILVAVVALLVVIGLLALSTIGLPSAL